MLIGLTYDLRDHYKALGFSDEDVAEFDFIGTIDAIDTTLKDLGFQTERIGTFKELISSFIDGKHWDLIFNIAEGVYGIGREAQVPAACDAYKMPYTFSDPCVMSLALNKELTKRVVRDLGLATPDFQLISDVKEIESVRLKYPLFAKPYAEGTGKGINSASVINDKNTLAAVCSDLLMRYNQPVLVETYLPGREFTVGIIGSGNAAIVAGVIEVTLHEGAEKGAYSYVNKEKCEELVTYTLVDDDITKKAADLALLAWKGLGCLDAGRIDIRCDSFGIPNFIEVNPLAGLHPEHSDLPIICTKAGIPYRNLIGSIMYSAIKRYNLLDNAPHGIPEYDTAAIKKKPGKPHSKNNSLKRIVILHQKIHDNAAEDEKDVLTQRDEIALSVQRLGFEAIKMEMTIDIVSVKNSLLQIKPWKVFNLVESLEGNDRLIGIAPALLDSIAIEYTGSRTEAIAMSSNKIIAKHIMQQAGIPTSACYSLSMLQKQKLTGGAYIIKPAYTHASFGIDENSVINIKDIEDINSILLERKKQNHIEHFIEKYIDGREFNLSILNSPNGPEVLPPAEIVFKDYPEGKPRILDYKSKWEVDSFEYNNTIRNFDFDKKDNRLIKSLKHYALKCWAVFGLGGYARVDFRVDSEGQPWVLEINANPCLAIDAGFMAAAERGRLNGDQVIQRILGI